MTVYLTDHHPRRRQWIEPRRGEPSGAIVLHTAENRADITADDESAENVARFIATRTDPGSYHSIVDSDTICRVGEYGWEMFGEGTGGNRWALHLAWATRARDWDLLPNKWVEAAIDNGAQEAARMAEWMWAERQILVPARWITAAEYRRGVAGFIRHADLDPGRRTDPGPGFPAELFFDRYDHWLVTLGVTQAQMGYVERWQRAIVPHGAQLGTSGPNGDGIDDIFGPGTLTASLAILDHLTDQANQVAATNVRLIILVDQVRAVCDANLALRAVGQFDLDGMVASLRAACIQALNGAGR